MQDMTTKAALLAAAYLAGSVNFSLLLFRILRRDDPRHHFSGNAGTTNVYRQAGLFWAAVIFLLEVGRALIVSQASLSLVELKFVPWVGVALVLGNCFPCFHQFRGGKGVASYLGFSILISPIAAALSALFWLGVYGIVRITFIASFSMVAVLMLGTIVACGYQTEAVAGATATALLIFYSHKQNMAAQFGRGMSSGHL